jgi:hypothetical protein
MDIYKKHLTDIIGLTILYIKQVYNFTILNKLLKVMMEKSLPQHFQRTDGWCESVTIGTAQSLLNCKA